MTALIDTHVHLYMPQFDSDRDMVIRNAVHDGVEAFISPAVDFASNEVNREITAKYPACMLRAVGLHPKYLEKLPDPVPEGKVPYMHFRDLDRYFSGISDTLSRVEAELDLLDREAGEDERIAAVGETGLDYRIPHLTRETRLLQIAAFRRQIEMALRHRLPLILHIRDGEKRMRSGMLWGFCGPITVHFAGWCTASAAAWRRQSSIANWDSAWGSAGRSLTTFRGSGMRRPGYPGMPCFWKRMPPT